MCWIKLADGKYVKDPIFYGKEWFLDCRSDEPMLIVHIYREPQEKNLQARMRKILRDANIPAKLNKDEESHRDRSPFPPNFKGLKQSASVRLEFLGLPLPETLACYANVYASLKPNEGEIANECIKGSTTAVSTD